MHDSDARLGCRRATHARGLSSPSPCCPSPPLERRGPSSRDSPQAGGGSLPIDRDPCPAACRAGAPGVRSRPRQRHPRQRPRQRRRRRHQVLLPVLPAGLPPPPCLRPSAVPYTAARTDAVRVRAVKAHSIPIEPWLSSLSAFADTARWPAGGPSRGGRRTAAGRLVRKAPRRHGQGRRRLSGPPMAGPPPVAAAATVPSLPPAARQRGTERRRRRRGRILRCTARGPRAWTGGP
jgi:hypothetical protein